MKSYTEFNVLTKFNTFTLTSPILLPPRQSVQYHNVNYLVQVAVERVKSTRVLQTVLLTFSTLLNLKKKLLRILQIV